MLFYILASLLVLQNVHAACDNQCSGHGTCTIDDICQCYDNFGVGLGQISGDCSDRICPYEISWVDKPDSSTGKFHKYAECAGKGICNRDSGECACLDGFEGKACQRTSCPNGCSGHGTCEYIEDLTYGVTWTDYSATYLYDQPKSFAYAEWDDRKIRACVCDPQYGGTDCSKKLCPYGADVLDTPNDLLVSKKYFKQRVDIVAAISINSLNGKTFALTFISKTGEKFTTIPIVFTSAPGVDGFYTDFENDVQLALLNLPNKVIDGVNVKITHPASSKTLQIVLTYSGNSVQGPQNFIVVETDACDKPACTPKITGLNVETRVSALYFSNETIAQESDFYQSYECGRRGKCDYTSGLCKCFTGYTGDNCDTLTTLA